MTTEALQAHPLAVLVGIAGLSGLVLLALLLRWRRGGSVVAHDQPAQRVGSVQTVRRTENSRLVALRIDVYLIQTVSSRERQIQIAVARNGTTVSIHKASVADARDLADRLRKAAARCGVT